MILTILTVLISVGYSALNQNLSVSGEAFLRAKDNIRISRIELSDAANDGYETYNPEYSKRTTKMYTTLPKDDSSVTYTVKVTNSTGIRYKVGSIDVTSTNSNVSCTPSIEVDSILEDGITEFTVTANYENGMSQDTNLNACDIKYEFVPLDATPPTLAVQLVSDNGNTKTIKITAIDEAEGSGLSPDNIYKYYLSTSETDLLGGIWKDYVNSTEFEISGDTEARYLWIYPVKDRAGNISGGNSGIEPYSVGKYIFIDNIPTLYNVIAKEALTDGVAKLYTGKHNDAYDESGTKKVFHFYGADDSKGTEVLTKNNVIFGGFCWQMIRTTDTGGTKLIYNGVPKEVDGKKVCTNSGANTTIGSSAFTSASDSPSYAGYMYNTVYQDKSKSMTSTDVYKYANSFTYSNETYKLSSDAISIDVTSSTGKASLNNAHYTCFNTTGECETIYNINYIDSNNLMYYIELQNGKSVEDALDEMLYADDVNKTNSAIKNVIDTWYANNMTNYTKYIEDTVFCNDRTIADYGGWNSNGGNVSLGVITFTNGQESNDELNFIINDIYCTNITDRFSVENGKAKLTYPVGMISVNEMYLLGNDNARKSGANQWLMSPEKFNYTYIGYIRHRLLGDVGDNIWTSQSTRVFYVRPSVSLEENTMYVSGTGSTTDPYIVDFTAPTIETELVTDGEREKTIKISVKDDGDLSSSNKYMYYLSTSKNELIGGELTSYTPGEIFSITGKNETKYLWVYPVMDNTGNISGEKTDTNTPYIIATYEFKDLPPYLYNVIKKESLTGSGLAKLYTGEHNDAYDESGTENIYYFYGADDTAATSVLNKNNVLFAGFCWQMIRTTDTGGTKLIYNGLPKEQDGKKVCTNSGSAVTIGNSAFNEEIDSPSYVGYMYNEVYHSKKHSANRENVWYGGLSLNTTNWYADSIIYENGNYSLVNPYQISSSEFANMKGKYTFNNSNKSYINPVIYYIGEVKNNDYYTITLTGGNDIDYYNDIYAYGTSYVKNEDGTYTIDNPTYSSRLEYYSDYANFKDKYLCKNSDNGICDNLLYISYSDDAGFYWLDLDNEYKFAKGFSYSNGKYILNDESVMIWNTSSKEEQQKISNAHYTCFNSNGECVILSYVYSIYGNNTTIYYIELQDGIGIDGALEKMLTADNVNQTSSTIKDTIDNWYQENMSNYTKYLEDTVFCNDRSIYDYGGWKPNGGLVNGSVEYWLKFKQYNVSSDLYCTNVTDRFSVGNDKAKLTYPVGLMSTSEMYLLGNDNVRSTGTSYWNSSAGYFSDHSRMSYVTTTGGSKSFNNASYDLAVRPAVSIAYGTGYASGTGTTIDPYIVDTSAPTVTLETLIDGEREKTVKIIVNDDLGLYDDNKYKYYLSTSETSLTGGEWKDYTSGEIFTLSGENETKYLWIYPVMDSAWNINDGKDDITTPYVLTSITFKDKKLLYKLFEKEVASGSGLVKLYTGQHSDTYNETGIENIYYFYGADDTAATSVLNKNNIIFAGFCWQMIRTTDTGGIKIIYNGIPKTVDGASVCTNTEEDQQIGTGTISFNSNYDNKVYVGYMYDSALSDLSKNTKDSRVKTNVDNWYANNMTNYTKYLEDTVFCNDRSVIRQSNTSYYFKNTNDGVTDLYCTNVTDRFSVGNEKAKLTYPVGMLSLPEVNIVGNFNIVRTGTWYWLISPRFFTTYANCAQVNKSDANGLGVNRSMPGIRPMVSLASTTEYSSGTGSKTDPYVIP